MYVEQRQVLNGRIHAAKLNEITISIQQVSILSVAQGILGSLVILPSQKKQQQQGKVSLAGYQQCLEGGIMHWMMFIQ